MKVKDNLDGLFEELEILNPDLMIFDMMSSQDLDVYYLAMSGEKTVSELGTKDIKLVARLVNSMYAKKWDNLIDTHIHNYMDIRKKGFKDIKTETDDGSTNLSRELLSEISAYNEGFADDSKDIETTDNTHINERLSETEHLKYLHISEINGIMDYLHKFNIYDIIKSDVDRMLALQVY